MKIIPESVDKKLFEQYPLGSDLSKQMAVAKIFNPYGKGTWYLLNSDPEDPDYIWAIVDLFEVEVGSVSREDLETIKVPPYNLNLEFDQSFKPMNAAELLAGLLRGEKFAGGGKANAKITVTRIEDIPDLESKIQRGEVTYRGLGMGKLADDFYKLTGDSGTRIKVGGKEYYVTETDFNKVARGRDGKMRIRFDAPYRKFDDGGTTGSQIESLSNKIRAINGEHGEEGNVLYLGGDKMTIGDYPDLKPYSAQSDHRGTSIAFTAPDRRQVSFTTTFSERAEDRKSYDKYGGIYYIYEPLTEQIASEIMGKVARFNESKFAGGGQPTSEQRKNMASIDDTLYDIRNENSKGRGYKIPTAAKNNSQIHNTLVHLESKGMVKNISDRRKPISQQGYWLVKAEEKQNGSLEGMSVKFYFTGQETPEFDIIKSAEFSPQEYENKSLFLSFGDTEERLYKEKVDEFMSGELVIMKDSKGNLYGIQLEKKYADGGHLKELGKEKDIDVHVKDDELKMKRYQAVFGDYDKDGIPNIDDPRPTRKGDKKMVEERSAESAFEKLINIKKGLDGTMHDAVKDIIRIAPEKSAVYARTKTPYSIVSKLISKRLIVPNNPKRGLTDLIGTTIAVDSYDDLLKMREQIESGKLYRVEEVEDFYANPLNGYRAVHYILMSDTMTGSTPIELQLKTKRMKEVNQLSHAAYAARDLNEIRMNELTELAHQADLGDKESIKQFNTLMKDKKAVERSLFKTGKKMAEGGGVEVKQQVHLEAIPKKGELKMSYSPAYKRGGKAGGSKTSLKERAKAILSNRKKS